MPDPFDLAAVPLAPEPRPTTVVGPPLPYLDGLNPAQRQAVEAIDGPVLVLAGAGTGKTRVLTCRLAHILMTGRAMPSHVLAVTFTNRAANEMRERVARLMERPIEGWWVGTFHALGARILRRDAELVGLKPNFTILDVDDQVRVLKQLLQADGVDERRWPARVLSVVIQRWKDRGLTPDRVSAAEADDFANGRALALYADYQRRLIELNAVDFGDLLLHCLVLFTEQPEVRARYQRQFRYLLVDEYQDTNVAQYLWLRLLAQGHHNICCVGDDDQSIYGWRGAEVGNILRFETDFPGARVIRLEQNYRSTPHILGAASGLIDCNQGRLGKTLWTDLDQGERIRVRGVWDSEAEARVVGEEIEALHAKGHRLSEIAILVRAGFQTREFEERFLTIGVPYRVIGGPRFYERLEIRDALAYLRVIHQPDDDLAFERIVNRPRRGIGDSTLRAMHELARAQRVSLFTAATRLVDTDEIRPATRRALGALLGHFLRWRDVAAAAPHTDLVQQVLDESGYVEMLRRDKSPDAPGRLENLDELALAMAEFDNLAGFLEHVSLVMETTAAAQGDMVTIMTLHAAKGLEFDTVFLPGWEEGLFPHRRALDENGLKGLEEERRLAYVGLTRARQRAFVGFAGNRRVNNLWQASLPSRFVAELPEAHVERLIDTGMYGGVPAQRTAAAAGHWGSVWDSGGLSRAPRPRERRRVNRDGLVIDAAARDVDGAASGGQYRLGTRVFHQKFGYGTVAEVEGDKLEIDFDKAGRKKIIDSFVQRA
jgi:DNA helicase-2/ATP-dependent DNA helicase PcrA